MLECVYVLAAQGVSFDNTGQNCFGAHPPALPLTKQPGLELQIVIQVKAFQELSPQQLVFFPPAFFRFKFHQRIDVDGRVACGDKGNRLSFQLPAFGQDLGQVVQLTAQITPPLGLNLIGLEQRCQEVARRRTPFSDKITEQCHGTP